MCLVLVSGCTVTPPAPKPREIPTYSGNSLNGGIIVALYRDDKPSETGFLGFLVTADWVANYNALASDYGDLLTPRVKPGDGLISADPATLAKYNLAAGSIVDAQHMVAWRDLRDLKLLGAEKEGVVSKAVNAITK